MKDLFPGYFKPSDEDFAKLWTDCIFAFDANVLLGLYRSTPETQNVFFAILEKVADRIFLPHQAASEYLRNRLSVISFRSEQYGKIRDDSQKFASMIKSIVQEHAIINGTEIVGSAKRAADTIGALADAAAEQEPDLLRSDSVLTRLDELFRSSTGEPYSAEKQKDIYAQGAQRYAQQIPPGYKDDKKGEPAKYGDLVIWFQLIDHAKEKKRPLIFVSGDSKEDWLQQHGGETLGPRPELRQEMMETSRVHFWMYTTPRFLEFAKQFLKLKLDTKKAESEFEKIEMQEKRATQNEFDYYYAGTQAALGNRAFSDWNTRYFGAQPTTLRFGLSNGPWMTLTEPEGSVSKQDFFALLPINGFVFRAATGKWKCEIVEHPEGDGADRRYYGLRFQPEDRSKESRNLRLWVSVRGLENDADWRYKKAISEAILRWLDTNETYGEIGVLP